MEGLMMQLFLVWYSLGWATVAVFPNWSDKISRKDFFYCMMIAPFFWAYIIAESFFMLAQQIFSRGKFYYEK